MDTFDGVNYFHFVLFPSVCSNSQDLYRGLCTIDSYPTTNVLNENQLTTCPDVLQEEISNLLVHNYEGFVIMGKHNLRIEILQFGQLNQSLSQLCSFESLVMAINGDLMRKQRAGHSLQIERQAVLNATETKTKKSKKFLGNPNVERIVC
ncbi:hypothetical protein KIN20_004382 [Parelaphostrongylus tenuis]|uniref:Uncharacterized protein n=1 Tax=Parelaphostrongylus tenuis TaxID=148309 RepID=A0AAD5QHZ5_PARTN|nr:hypothetical protein KIN20_004382 [Parelaphostrongylus tenuis]